MKYFLTFLIWHNVTLKSKMAANMAAAALSIHLYDHNYAIMCFVCGCPVCTGSGLNGAIFAL